MLQLHKYCRSIAGDQRLNHNEENSLCEMIRLGKENNYALWFYGVEVFNFKSIAAKRSSINIFDCVMEHIFLKYFRKFKMFLERSHYSIIHFQSIIILQILKELMIVLVWKVCSSKRKLIYEEINTVETLLLNSPLQSNASSRFTEQQKFLWLQTATLWSSYCIFCTIKTTKQREK